MFKLLVILIFSTIIFYFVTGLYEGIVYKYNPNNQESELFVDISEKLIFTEDKNNEMGLLSFELHPSLEYFLVAYVNKSMKLLLNNTSLILKRLT